MKYIADLHVHSKYSRATAKNLDLENLYIQAQIKGIDLVGSGDFTHPQWFEELCTKLMPAEDGFFKLREELEHAADQQVPASCRAEVRFILQTEISNIYKKNNKTRKNHNLIFLPDLESAAHFNARLDAIGNIKSDGRPILGLDARNLLEIMLEISSHGFLIPAHIWTPWFSMLGSKSGFDSVQECFEDLSPHIFAVETGLSSDPPMNWRITMLDNLALVSNSDAHSPAKLGRNANIIDSEFSFKGLRSALQNHNIETINLYPEEGKYHFDGHRKCNVCLAPAQTIAMGNNCPVCKQPLTLGVLYRVEALADRPKGQKPVNRPSHQYIIPLAEILSEILKVGPQSKRVGRHYQHAIERLGPELHILRLVPQEEIDKAVINPLLGKAVTKMRRGHIHVSPGYDGEYGRITVFTPEKKHEFPTMFARLSKPVKQKKQTSAIKKTVLNPEQLKAIHHPGGPLLIIAGPGTGKTATLTRRIAYLVDQGTAVPASILALTFTNKAALEMQTRLGLLLKPEYVPLVSTFHGLALKIIRASSQIEYTVIDEEESKNFLKQAIQRTKDQGFKTVPKLAVIASWIEHTKQTLKEPDHEDPADFRMIYNNYQDLLQTNQCLDYEDLIFKVIKEYPDAVSRYREIFMHIFIDEYQDLNFGQYCLLKALAKQEICAIGDPNQAIYGFRGSDVKYFYEFQKDFPDSTLITLSRSYRSTKTILKAAGQVIASLPSAKDARIYSTIDGTTAITVLETTSAKAEAVAVGRLIEHKVGGLRFDSMDFNKISSNKGQPDRSFADFAVLYRTSAQGRLLYEVLEKAGIPCQLVNQRLLSSEQIHILIAYLKITEGMATFHDLENIITQKNWSISPKAIKQIREWSITPEQFLQKIKRQPVPDMKVTVQRHLCTLVDQIAIFKDQMHGRSIADKILYLQEKVAGLSQVSLNVLLGLARPYDRHTRRFIDALSLQTEPDIYEQNAEKVTLMSMHASKGLEFEVVFITGCEDGFIPFQKSDEELRLFYVAMTRAKEQLFLVWSKKRQIYGQTKERMLSPFINSIENRHLVYRQSSIKTNQTAQSKQIQLDLFHAAGQ